jgi:hypothetical protein
VVVTGWLIKREGASGFGFLFVDGRAGQFAGYEGAESLVEGDWVEEERAPARSAILALLSLSCSFSILKRSVSCSIS